MEYSRNEIIDQYGKALNPLIGEGEFKTRLIGELEKVLSNLDKEKPDRSSSVIPEEIGQDFFDEIPRPFKMRIIKAFNRAHISQYSELIEIVKSSPDPSNWIHIKNLGPKSVYHIIRKLEEKGLYTVPTILKK